MAKPKSVRPQKYFGKFQEPLVKMPSFVESQIASFTEFVEGGAERVFKEFSPISDHSGKKFELELVKFSFADLRIDEHNAKKLNRTYEAPLSMVVRLKNKTTGEKKEQEIFLADFPLMTPHGTFIINGVERIIVPQLARSYGVFFEGSSSRARTISRAKIIPARGVWIEIESDADGAIYVKIDRKRRFPVTSLLRVLGRTTDAEMMQANSARTAARDADRQHRIARRPRQNGLKKRTSRYTAACATATSRRRRTRATTSMRSSSARALRLLARSAASASTAASACRPTRRTSLTRTLTLEDLVRIVDANR